MDTIAVDIIRDLDVGDILVPGPLLPHFDADEGLELVVTAIEKNVWHFTASWHNIVLGFWTASVLGEVVTWNT